MPFPGQFTPTQSSTTITPQRWSCGVQPWCQLLPQSPAAPTLNLGLQPGQHLQEPSRPQRVGQGSFPRLDLSKNFLQDLEVKRPSTGPSTNKGLLPKSPQGLAGVRSERLSSYSRQQKSNLLNHSIEFRKGTQTWNAKPHRNAFRQQNEKERA